MTTVLSSRTCKLSLAKLGDKKTVVSMQLLSQVVGIIASHVTM